MTTLLTTIVAGCICLYFVWRRGLRYLHIYQQDEYDTRRFLPWIIRTAAFDKRLSAVLLLVAAASLAVPVELRWTMVALAGAVLLVFALREPNPRNTAKKALVLTKRASSILRLALVFMTAAVFLLSWWLPLWGLIVAVQLVPLSLMVANFLLQPLEKRVQNRYLREARGRLQQIDPAVVGITGSFGKTSAKHILGHVLALNTRSFITPGSVNTPMGVTRVIREMLPPDTRYFVVEMGAYGPGSIDRLCQLTPPRVGIITSIGEAHYERFKDLETVARAKFELAEAVLRRSEGRVFIHSSVLARAYAREMVARHRDRFVICGEGPDADLQVVHVAQTREGLLLNLTFRGQTHEVQTSLYGLQQVGNLALVFAAAIELGLSPERVVASLRTVPQVQHRLEVKKQADGSILIDDAYNSNPVGFAAGLQLLTTLQREGGRRILVTPGLVELGEKHDEVHAQLGADAARHVDVAVVVGAGRIPTFAQAFAGQAGADRMICVENFVAASQWLRDNVKPADTVLLENDLPDLYERKLTL